MSKANGQMLTCDRCGTWIFLKCTGEGEMDGGFTRWNNFEPASGWEYVHDVGTVCPKCLHDYRDMLERYKKKPPKSKEGPK